MHAQSCCFANLNLFPFSRSRCHRCRRRGRKLQDGNFSLWNPESENFAGGIRNTASGGSTGKEPAIHNVESTYITSIFEDSHSTL